MELLKKKKMEKESRFLSPWLVNLLRKLTGWPESWNKIAHDPHHCLSRLHRQRVTLAPALLHIPESVRNMFSIYLNDLHHSWVSSSIALDQGRNSDSTVPHVKSSKWYSMGKCRREGKGTYVSSPCLLMPANRGTWNLTCQVYYDWHNIVTLHLTSLIGSATRSKTMYKETNVTTG